MTKYLLLFLMLPGVGLPACSQRPFDHPGYSQSTFESVRYGLFRPVVEAGRRYPLLVYLHGANDTVSRDLSWYSAERQAQFPCFVLTPKCTVSDQGWGNTWVAGHTSTTAAVLRLIDSLVKVCAVDTSRLYIYGISMGGFGVFAVLQKNPGLFAAAYSVCGGSDTKAAAVLTQTPLWIFHGGEDNVVPVSLSRDVYQAIKEAGGTKVRYTEYPGVRHDSWLNVEKETELPGWLFSHRK